MKYLLFSILIISAFKLKVRVVKEDVNVLLVGNSLTYNQGMPQTLQSMLDETDPHIKIDQSTFPSLSLDRHLINIVTFADESTTESREKEPGEVTQTEKKVLDKDWDIIVLQTKTKDVLIPEVRDTVLNDAVASFKSLASNPNCRFVLFTTWPSPERGYPERYGYINHTIDRTKSFPIITTNWYSPWIRSLEKETQYINEGYAIVAEQNNIERTNHADKFYELITRHPDISLYEKEGDYCLNKNGAFLSACILYHMLTGKKPSKLKYKGNIKPEVAKVLKEVAE